jgi:hypothetical protein
MKILDRYFRHPVFYDFLFSTVVAILLIIGMHKGTIIAPSTDLLYSMVSDLSTVSLTLAGFLLTLITVLISFKSTNRIDRDDIKETDTVFDIFFASALYFETIKHLKSGIVSLVFIAVAGYVLKLSIAENVAYYLLPFNAAGLMIVVFSLSRGVIILSQIVKMQKEH